MPRITPCLTFKNNAEEAVTFYTSIFKNSKVKYKTHYGEGMHMPAGTVLTIMFELDGQEFLALNGPDYKFTGAISLMVNCANQKEIDEYWAKLSKGGEEIQCGWLTDKFGLSWQVIPADLGAMMTQSQKKTDQMMKAVMQMVKLDVVKMKQAIS